MNVKKRVEYMKLPTYICICALEQYEPFYFKSTKNEKLTQLLIKNEIMKN